MRNGTAACDVVATSAVLLLLLLGDL